MNTLCEVRELDDIKSKKISTNQLEFIRVTMTSFHLSPSQDYQKGKVGVFRGRRNLEFRLQSAKKSFNTNLYTTVIGRVFMFNSCAVLFLLFCEKCSGKVDIKMLIIFLNTVSAIMGGRRILFLIF